jgi:arginyl-tRNA synthetase
MDYAADRFDREVRDALRLQARVPPCLAEVAPPKPGIPADLVFPVFRFARERGLPAPQLAGDLAATLHFGPASLVGRVVATGPFLNFHLEPARLAAAVLGEIAQLGPRYGQDDRGAGRSTLVEYSSPNMARRMHVGHIRSTIIGHALANISAALGYRVVRDSHIGDWGKNFGVLLLAIRREGRPVGAGESALAALEHLYAKYTRLIGEDPAADREAREWSLRLEQGDPEARELWQWIVRMTLRVNQPLYDRLGVRFDTVHGESFFNDKMAPIVARALERGIAHRNEEGAVVVGLPGLPTFLLQRSDGGTLYHTRDAATIAFRIREYQPAAIVYVVDARQELHFRQLFALVGALDVAPPDTALAHVSFGVVVGPDGQPLAARRGNMVYLQALLDEAHIRARAIVDETSPELPEEEKETIAEAVGVSAVIYNDLYQDPRRTITLDWERMLSLQGNSAPYIQYMHARCRSILRKADTERQNGHQPPADTALLTHQSEIALVKQLARLPGAVRAAGARYAPFLLAEWCYETARATAAFYRDCPVLAAATAALRDARLRLVAATAQSLSNGLQLLGIAAPERM